MIRVRPATFEELARVVGFERREDIAWFISADPPEWHNHLFAQKNVTYLAIDEDDAMVGYAILVREPDEMSVEIRRFVVAAMDRGIGQVALRLVEDFCVEALGSHRVWLDVWRQNPRAYHVYRKLGYRLFRGPPGHPDDIDFLEKRL